MKEVVSFRISYKAGITEGIFNSYEDNVFEAVNDLLSLNNAFDKGTVTEIVSVTKFIKNVGSELIYLKGVRMI